MSKYNGAVISSEELTVLKLIENQIGKPIPYKGEMPYGQADYFSSDNPETLDIN